MPLVQCWTNVEDVGPTLYKCYTHVLRRMRRHNFKRLQNAVNTSMVTVNSSHYFVHIFNITW